MSSKQKYPLRGVVVSLNTPFEESGRIDAGSLARLVERHLGEGAAGFLMPAYAAEVYNLTLAERIELVRCVREVAKGRAEVIAGCTAADESESFRVAEGALRAGCEGVLVEVPGELRGNAPRIMDFFRSFASVGMPMLMIQDWEWGGYGLDVGLILELFEKIPPFRCLKVEVSPAGPKYSAVRAATGGRLHISGGWAAQQMIEALDRGVDVFMPTAMTGLYVKIFEAYHNGDLETARKWFHKILPVLAFTHQHLDISIQFYKRWFHHCGLFRTAKVRNLSVGYDSYHERYGEWLIGYLERVEREAGLPLPEASGGDPG